MKTRYFIVLLFVALFFVLPQYSYSQEQDSVYYDVSDQTESVTSSSDTTSVPSKAKKKKKKKEKDPFKSNAFMNQVRSAISIFNLGLSTGYGYTLNSHNLEGFAILQPEEGGLYIYDKTYFGDNTLPAVYDDWINNPQPLTTLDTMNNPITIGPNDFTWNTDSTMVGYRGSSNSIPLIATLHVDIGRYRIGGGFGFEFHWVGDFRPTALTDTLRNFVPSFRMATYKRYFIYGGYSIYKSKFYQMVADLRVGKISRGKNYNKELISNSIYYNLGFVIEKSLSEYIKAFVRPSVEWKTYSLSIPETGLRINHSQPAFFVGFGLTLRMPELRRCPVKQCNIQINHRHKNKEFRSSQHRYFFKYQDPDYGQNFAKPLRLKKKYKQF